MQRSFTDLLPELRERLQQFAQDEGVSQDEVAVTLIDEGLDRKGYGS